MKRRLFMATAVVAAAAFTLGAADKASAELDLAGTTVEWVIPFSEKGGSAKWANFYARCSAKRCLASPPSW